MSKSGVVRIWTDEGWGVIDAPEVRGGCWAHFSVLAARWFWEPAVGEAVEFDFETVDQDGFGFRATRMWPSGSKPVDQQLEAPAHPYTSKLTIDFD